MLSLIESLVSERKTRRAYAAFQNELPAVAELYRAARAERPGSRAARVAEYRAAKACAALAERYAAHGYTLSEVRNAAQYYFGAF